MAKAKTKKSAQHQDEVAESFKGFRKAMLERGIKFVVFARDDKDVERLAECYEANFVKWMD